VRFRTRRIVASLVYSKSLEGSYSTFRERVGYLFIYLLGKLARDYSRLGLEKSQGQNLVAIDILLLVEFW
jgi:hypothetical protein